MSSHQSNIPAEQPKPRGCRNALIVFAVILLILISIPVIILIRAQPGNAQWEEAIGKSPVYSPGGITYTAEGVILKDVWLNYQLNQLVSEALKNEEAPLAAFLEVSLDQDALYVQAAASIPTGFPLLRNGDFKMLLSLGMNSEMVKGSRIRLELTEFRLGRIRVPLALIKKISNMDSEKTPDFLKDQDNPGFSRKGNYTYIDLAYLAEEISPGMVISRVQVNPGEVLVSLDLSDSQVKAIREFSRILTPHLPEIHGKLQQEISSAKLKRLSECENLIGDLNRKGLTREILLKETITVISLYDEMYNSLPPREKETAQAVLEEYVKQNPELSEQLELLRQNA